MDEFQEGGMRARPGRAQEMLEVGAESRAIRGRHAGQREVARPGDGLQDVRPGTACLHGPGELRAEALPADDDEYLGCGMHSQSK